MNQVTNFAPSNDPVWHTGVARIEVMIERYGICNAVGAVLQAIENMEEEMLKDIPGFEGTPHHKNIEHQKRVIEAAMSAVDLNTIYGSAEARKISGERFNDNIKQIGVMA